MGILAVCFIIGSVILFNYFPEIDIYVSSLFYNSEQGFFLQDNLFIQFMYRFTQAFCLAFMVGIIYLGVKKYLKIKSFNLRYYKKLIYVILVVAIGPGFIVHTVLKDNIGRPRPFQVQEFGGQNAFQHTFTVSKICDMNCSFVSGHASVGFMVYALAFLYHDYRRRRYFILGTVLGLSFGMVRVIQGKHFLSDIIFAGIVVFITAYILAVIMNPANKQQ